jgi:hypothetical protein
MKLITIFAIITYIFAKRSKEYTETREKSREGKTIISFKQGDLIIIGEELFFKILKLEGEKGDETKKIRSKALKVKFKSHYEKKKPITIPFTKKDFTFNILRDGEKGLAEVVIIINHQWMLTLKFKEFQTGEKFEQTLKKYFTHEEKSKFSLPDIGKWFSETKNSIKRGINSLFVKINLDRFGILDTVNDGYLENKGDNIILTITQGDILDILKTLNHNADVEERAFEVTAEKDASTYLSVRNIIKNEDKELRFTENTITAPLNYCKYVIRNNVSKDKNPKDKAIDNALKANPDYNSLKHNTINNNDLTPEDKASRDDSPNGNPVTHATEDNTYVDQPLAVDFKPNTLGEITDDVFSEDYESFELDIIMGHITIVLKFEQKEKRTELAQLLKDIGIVNKHGKRKETMISREVGSYFNSLNPFENKKKLYKKH